MRKHERAARGDSLGLNATNSHFCLRIAIYAGTLVACCVVAQAQLAPIKPMDLETGG
jgi:hypothetical protein